MNKQVLIQKQFPKVLRPLPLPVFLQKSNLPDFPKFLPQPAQFLPQVHLLQPVLKSPEQNKFLPPPAPVQLNLR